MLAKLEAHGARRRAPLSIVVPAVLAGLIALAPLAFLAQVMFERGFGYVWEELFRSRTLELLVNSLSLTVAVTLGCVLIAVPAAWLVTRTNLWGRSVWRVVLALPLSVPSYLAAFAWVSWRPGIAGFWGAALVLIAVSYPYVYLPVAAAMTRLDPAIEELAEIHGRGGSIRQMVIAARQVRGPILSGMLLVALYALSDFGAVAAMRFDAFTWVIFGAYRAGFNPSRAAVLASVLIVVALVLVILESASRGAQVRTVSARSVGHTHNVKINQPVMQMILGTTVAIALAFPVWRVTTWVWGNFDRDSITPMLESVWASVRYSLFAALITVLLALPVAVLASRYKSRGAKILEGATFVTHALPGIVIGISMVFVGVKALRPIYLEAPLLILAYVVLFLPLAVASLRAALDQIPTSLDDVARSLGASPISVLRRVSLPIVLPSLGAAVALITLAAMKELPVTMLLHPTGVDTIATRLWTHTSVSDYASAGPYALAMLLFVAVPTAIASRSGT